jgi:DNA-binding transcriptional regulator of glucitol operon
LPILVAVSFSILCGALAWVQWRAHSELTVPSIATRPARTK